LSARFRPKGLYCKQRVLLQILEELPKNEVDTGQKILGCLSRRERSLIFEHLLEDLET
jgi:hypothetical protein